MKFAQIIDFETERMEEMDAIMQARREKAQGMEGGPTHRTVLQDRDNPNRRLVVIEFESHEEAMRNNDNPETTAMAQQLAALCTKQPTFTNCDIVDQGDIK